MSKLKVLNGITCAILNISTMCHKNHDISHASSEKPIMLCFSCFHTMTGMARMISVFVSMVDQLLHS